MEGKFYLQWNVVNWITVVLMATVGMLLVGAVASAVRQYTGAGAASNAND